MIVIVDCGTGNLHSVLHKVTKLDVRAVIATRPEELKEELDGKAAERIVDLLTL